MPTLFIRALSIPRTLDEGLEFSCEWLIADPDGRQRSHGSGDFICGSDELQDWTPFWRRPGASDRTANGIESGEEWARNPANVVFLAPGEHTLSVTCEVPGRSASQIRRALPYAVEEFIAGHIEGSHIAIGPVRRGQPIRCSIIDDGLLQDWLACLAALGIRPGYLVSEAELLPIEPRTASVLIQNGHALLRTEDQAATIDRGNLLPALMSLDIDKLSLIDGGLTDMEASQLNIEVERAKPVQWVEQGGLLGYFAERWRAQRSRPQPALNLLQGEYAPELPRNAHTTRWRSVALLAAAWLLLGVAGTAATGIWSAIEAESLERESLAIYESIFPADRTATVQNIRRRMQARLGERPDVAGKSMVEFTGDLAAVMDKSMTLVGIDYNEARGEFATELLVRRYDDVDRLREALEARGVQAEIASAEQVEQGVQARLRMQAPR